MSSILYKDGRQEMVRAEYVTHMLRQGYSADPKAAPKPKVKPDDDTAVIIAEVSTNQEKKAKKAAKNAD